MTIARGAFIVVEGIDRAGKTTQCHALVEQLSKENVPVTFLQFPNRSSESGRIINSFLLREIELDQHQIHMLFAQNRLEMKYVHSNDMYSLTYVEKQYIL